MRLKLSDLLELADGLSGTDSGTIDMIEARPGEFVPRESTGQAVRRVILAFDGVGRVVRARKRDRA